MPNTSLGLFHSIPTPNMPSTFSATYLRGSSSSNCNTNHDSVVDINRSGGATPSKKRKRERAFEPVSPSSFSVAEGCISNNESSDWDSSDCDSDSDDDSCNDTSDDRNTTNLRNWNSNHHFNIFDGCYSHNPENEDRYLDVCFRERATAAAPNSPPLAAKNRWKWKGYYSDSTTDGWFRGLFQSQMTLSEVESILERMVADYDEPIEHLYFGNEETVREFDRNVPPVLFPIKLLGKILELCHRNGIRNRGKGNNKRLRSNSIKTLTLSNLLFVGRTRDEFECVFRQMSRCDSILEIVLNDFDFHVTDGSNDDHRLLEIRRSSFGEDSFARVPFNSSIFKGMIMAFNEMESLAMLDIDNTRDMIFDDVFVDALLHNPTTKKRKPMKVLSFSKCVLSDCMLTAIFGKDSRVKRFALINCGDLQARLPLITNLLKNENRTMENLKFASSDTRGVMRVLETLELLKALGSNHTLKHLHIDVKCKPTGNNNDFVPALNETTARSFCEAIEHLAGLENLALDFLLFAPTRTIDDDDDEYVDFDDDHCKDSLRHIWSILKNGIGKNDTLRAFRFMISGIKQQSDSEEKEKVKAWISKEVNRSLTHALSRSTLAALLPRTPNQTKPISRLTPKRSRLQDYSFYIDGAFDVHPDPTTAFWLSLNENGIRRLLHKQSDDLELWRDTIVRHGSSSSSSSDDETKKSQSSTIDPSIVYHILQQNNGLLMNRNNR